jgi:hypothetical protein
MVPYRRVLEQLPPINYLTTRKLIGHLHFIHEQHEKNLMPVENLAAIWGPTLMHIEVLEWFGLILIFWLNFMPHLNTKTSEMKSNACISIY